MTTQRQDPHRPSAIQAGDYRVIDGDQAFHYYRAGWSHCAHCGHALKYAVRFEYLPTGEILDIGEDCAQFIAPADTRIEYELLRLRKRIANERKEAKYEQEALERRQQFEIDEPEVAEFLKFVDENEKFGFLRDMKAAYDRWGSLTDRQLAATKRTMLARQEQASRELFEATLLKDAPLSPEGRQTIEGTVTSVKGQHTDFRYVYKMLVRLDDGNKVYGTVPAKLEQALINQKDARVKFAATFKRKDGEDHFSYFSRPSNAEVL